MCKGEIFMPEKKIQPDNQNKEVNKTKKGWWVPLVSVLGSLALVGSVFAIIIGVKGCNGGGNSSVNPDSSDTSGDTSSDSSSSGSTSEDTSSDASSSDSTSSETSEDSSSSAPSHVHSAGTPVKENEVPATCTENGSYDLVTYCTTCLEKISEEHKTTSALGHDFNAPTYEWNGDYSECTASRVCKHNSSHIETETESSAYNVVTPETVEDDGLARYTVNFTNDAFNTQVHDVVLPKDKYATKPHLIADNKIKYGLYPQTIVSSTLETALDDAKTAGTITPSEDNGYYLYDGDYYAEASNNWYKCEPITWKILNSSAASTDGYYYVVSDLLLDAHHYYNYNGHGTGYTGTRSISGETHGINNNNYEYSDIRAWLNGLDGSAYTADNYTSSSFYKSAFGLNDSHIMEWDVSHIASTTNNASNVYAAGGSKGSKNTTTHDKVSLLSYVDCVNYFNDDNIRKATVTAYAVAKGAYSTTSAAGGYGYYLTRSPFYNLSIPDLERLVSSVFIDGSMSRSDVASVDRCVRPCIRISISAS